MSLLLVRPACCAPNRSPSAGTRRIEDAQDGIAPNVAGGVEEVHGIADEAVEVVGLPEGIQRGEARFVDQAARNALPALERAGASQGIKCLSLYKAKRRHFLSSIATS